MSETSPFDAPVSDGQTAIDVPESLGARLQRGASERKAAADPMADKVAALNGQQDGGPDSEPENGITEDRDPRNTPDVPTAATDDDKPAADPSDSVIANALRRKGSNLQTEAKGLRIKANQIMRDAAEAFRTADRLDGGE